MNDPLEMVSTEKPHLLKPLEELTDADIRQLTREDCRRYLKERGMRRPSWNKAQAIQQVLSLRSLLCSSKPTENEISATINEVPVINGKNTQFSQQKVAASVRCRSATLENTQQHTAQLTIFYSGVVNVYDDVPLEKAQAIMLLAGSKAFQMPASIPQMVHQEQEQNQQMNRVLSPPETVPNTIPHSEDTTASALAQVRTASLQRFLAKRRERILRGGKLKKRRQSSLHAISRENNNNELSGASGSSDTSSSGDVSQNDGVFSVGFQRAIGAVAI